MAEEQYRTFSEMRARLDEIVAEVRKKDLSLEKSLDLYEEAIELGNRCAELVDRTDYTAAEAEAARQMIQASAPDVTLSGDVANGEQDSNASEEEEHEPHDAAN